MTDQQRTIRFRPAERPWRLWQVETAFACNLRCVMCPWLGVREELCGGQGDGLMAPEVFEALRPHLGAVTEIDFSGGGEPLLQPRLFDWIAAAGEAGCRTGFLTNGSLLRSEAAARVLAAGTSWVAFSCDGATATTYEGVRAGGSFELLCANIERLAAARSGATPRIVINVLMMPENVGELEAMVRLAADLGADQVNFKHCDVVRGEAGRGRALFGARPDRSTRRLEAQLRRARRLARRLGLETTAFAFAPEELPVCDQDPRTSVFVRHDGWVAPCISLALSGRAWFLGRDVEMPAVLYGRLTEQDLRDIWESAAARLYRGRFEERLCARDAVLSRRELASSLPRLKRQLEEARRAMPEAPDGCRTCHYLFDV